MSEDNVIRFARVFTDAQKPVPDILDALAYAMNLLEQADMTAEELLAAWKAEKARRIAAAKAEGSEML